MEDSPAQDLMISNDTNDAMVATPIITKFTVTIGVIGKCKIKNVYQNPMIIRHLIHMMYKRCHSYEHITA